MSGAASPSRVAKNAPDSPTFDAIGPRPVSFQRSSAPVPAMSTRSVVPLVRHRIAAAGWSCRFSPTPGTLATTSMSSSRRCSAGPTPDSMSSCGELTAPPDRMTSPSTCTSVVAPWREYRTPIARVPANSTDDTSASVRTVRFDRSSAGRRYASAVDQRWPLWHVTW